MLSICLSLVITLRPFTRKPFNYEGGSSHKSCSCIFSAKLSKMVHRAFLHPPIEHFGAGFRSGTGVGWGQGSRSVWSRPLPEGQRWDGQRWEALYSQDYGGTEDEGGKEAGIILQRFRAAQNFSSTRGQVLLCGLGTGRWLDFSTSWM